jgi:hypothetical protein
MSHHVPDVAALRRQLAAALELEHATIPPYLVALYSLRPGTNSEAYHVLRAVVVEEMLHLTLVANLLNAVGGDPDLTHDGFVPTYPACLPDGETDFEVGLQAFSKGAVDTFLKIERPARAGGEEVLTVRRPQNEDSLRAARVHDDSEEHFYSIGEFYQAIEHALVELNAEHGDALFDGDPARQVTPEYYYSGGGEIVAVTDLKSAMAAIRLISEQGEGVTGALFDFEDEIAHFYRFEQLLLGRFYQPGDVPGSPSGLPLEVDWDAVLPIKTNARLTDYPAGSELHAGAEAFNAYYADFLALLTRAFRGEPGLLVEAVGGMFRIKELAYQLMRQPIDGVAGPNAAPTFEMPPTGRDSR